MKRFEMLLVVGVVSVCGGTGCDSPGAEARADGVRQGGSAAEAERAESLERELAAARSELAARDDEIAALQATVRRLEQTPQGLFDEALEALEAERWGEAGEGFGELVRRFPNDPLVEAALEHQARAKDGELVAYVESLEQSLDLGDKSSFAGAAESLAAKIEACGACKSRRRAEKKLAAIQATMRQWPVEVPDLKTLQVRYGDLRGRLVVVSERVGVEAATYYNCEFDSQSRWRSMKLQSAEYDRLHGYCRRGAQDCERLFSRATSEMVVLEDLVVRYPRGNSICEEGQVEIVSWGG